MARSRRLNRVIKSTKKGGLQPSISLADFIDIIG